MGIERIAALRDPVDSDLAFIYNSWLKSYRSSAFARHIHDKVYFTAHHEIISDLLERSTVLIACNKERPEEILGYIVADRVEGVFTVHYIYIKHTFRKFGIATMLVEALPRDKHPDFYGNPVTELGCISHATKFNRHIEAKFNLVYNPYLLGVAIPSKQTMHEVAEEAKELDTELIGEKGSFVGPKYEHGRRRPTYVKTTGENVSIGPVKQDPLPPVVTETVDPSLNASLADLTIPELKKLLPTLSESELLEIMEEANLESSFVTPEASNE